MARVLTDIVRPELRRAARLARAARRFERPGPGRSGRANGPTSVTVFFDGGSPRAQRETAALRRALQPGRADILWRDLRRHPDALTLWHVVRADWRGRLFVVDRRGALRRSLDARRALWRELPLGSRKLVQIAAALLARCDIRRSARWLSAPGRLDRRPSRAHLPWTEGTP